MFPRRRIRASFLRCAQCRADHRHRRFRRNSRCHPERYPLRHRHRPQLHSRHTRHRQSAHGRHPGLYRHGTYSDASTQNLTSTATWASTNSAVASISNTAGTQGQAKGLTGGSTFITATQGGITSNQASLTVTTANHFVISSPGSAIAGNPFSLTVFAEDSLGNIVTGYAGTVHFTSTDGQAVLPANATLTNGSGTFSVTLKTLGTQTVTATDTVTSSITGTSSSITVSSGTATHFLVTAPATATPGTAFNFTVSARDSSNNVATGYSGTVHFTSTDGQAVLPANSASPAALALSPPL